MVHPTIAGYLELLACAVELITKGDIADQNIGQLPTWWDDHQSMNRFFSYFLMYQSNIIKSFSITIVNIFNINYAQVSCVRFCPVAHRLYDPTTSPAA